MLRLEKLEIYGFKSFPDRTTLLFGEGITAVVGPNGCGKSNIVDAISWALGEQSAKSLRGSRMEDVIFNGARDRKPMGMAEVLLTLVATQDITSREKEEDESRCEEALQKAKRADMEARAAVEGTTNEPQRSAAGRHKRPKIVLSAGERITIGRRIYRTGDSEYLINGRPCLLRDIQDLFAGTGLGGAHYAILEQGRIEQILSSKPLDRRAIIEEAAGITKFKSRKRAAELKLESAKQNLSRINDIIGEVERQLNGLKRQAAKAERYRRLCDEMRSLMKVIFAADYHRLSQAAEWLQRELQEAQSSERELESLLSERELEHRAASARARAAEDRLIALKERAAALELEADRARNRRQFHQEQISQLRDRVQQLELEQKSLSERLELIESERERRAQELACLEEEVATGQASLLEREAEYQNSLQKLQQMEASIEHLRQKMVTEIARLERLRNMESSLRESLGKLELRGEGLKAELARAEARLEEAERECARIEAEIKSGCDHLEEIQNHMAALSTELSAQRERKAELERALGTIGAELAQRRYRLASLEELALKRAYHSETTREMLSPERAQRINALGALSDFVNVEPQYERLVESLFERELECILVPTIDDALAGMELIKSEGLGRGAFLVVGLHGAEGKEELIAARPPEDGAAPVRFQLARLRAVDLLGLRPEIKAAFERAFPEKSFAAVVPDIEAALQLSIENSALIYVAMSGEQVVGGRVIISAAPTSKNAASVLGLKRQMATLRAEIQQLSASEEELARDLARAEEQLGQIEGEVANLDANLRESEKSIAALRSRLEGLIGDLERARQHVSVVEAEIELNRAEQRELRSRLEVTRGEVSSAESSLSATKRALEEQTETISKMRSAIEENSHQLASARANLAARAERLKAALYEARRLELAAEELRSRAGQNAASISQLRDRMQQLMGSLREGEGASGELAAEGERLSEQIESAAKELTASRQQADQLDAQLQDLRHRLASARERRSELEIERARLESEAEHLARACFSELAMRLEEVVAGAEQQAPNLDQARSRLDHLRGKLADMGPVNMMALEELQQTEARYKFLSEQRSDILESIRMTEEALSEINRRSRERFRHAFAHINDNFQRMFAELFGGGRAQMVLVDEEDLLDAGVDLIVQPPGKRLQNVLLLSGGEKAMAAIALLLAIFQYKPSPFCVLDEVDAPLDEVNVARFAEKISQMSRQTQFLVITHNKGTMEAAQTLYGVTMEEPGVSKLASVKLE
jgi:chromosome segregation protein